MNQDYKLILGIGLLMIPVLWIVGNVFYESARARGWWDASMMMITLILFLACVFSGTFLIFDHIQTKEKAKLINKPNPNVVGVEALKQTQAVFFSNLNIGRSIENNLKEKGKHEADG